MTERVGTVPLPTSSGDASVRVWYDPAAAPGQWQQPQAQQVAVFEAVSNDDCMNGALIDVNQHFVVYAVKNGLIRVLHRQSSLRALLRGHTGKITDLAFFQNGDVLGSVGGNVIVWRIFERSPEIVCEKLLEIPDKLPSISRLIWHPFNPNQFWLIHHNPDALQIASLVETTRITTLPHESESHAMCQLQSDHVLMDGAIQLQVPMAHISDLCWSGRDTRHVMTAHQDGTVRLWDCKRIGTEPPDATTAQCVVTLQEDEAVTRCLFLPHDNVFRTSTDTNLTSAFVTATHGNSRLTLWSAFSENSPPTKLQVFAMEHPSPAYNLSLCFGPPPVDGSPPAFFLLLSDRSQGKVFCIHLKSVWSNETPKKALAVGWDYVVPFLTKYSIYSWSITCVPAENLVEDEVNSNCGLNFDMKFYAYQSKMVQQYTLPHYMCLPPQTPWHEGTPGSRVEFFVPAPIDTIVTDQSYDEDYELDDDYQEDDNNDGENTDDDDEDDDDEYNEAPAASSLPSPDGLGIISGDGKPEVPVENNPFANWLGAIAANTAAGRSRSPRDHNDLPPPPPPPPPTPATIKATHVPAGSVLMPSIEIPPRPSRVPSTGRAFLSPMELISGSNLEQAAGSLPSDSMALSNALSKSFDEKKPKTTKPVTTKPKATNKTNGTKKNIPPGPIPSADGKIAILKREDAPSSLQDIPPPPTPSLPVQPATVPSNLEEILNKTLSAHLKKQETLIVNEVQKAVHTEMQTNVLPNLGKMITQTMEKAVVKPVQVSMDKAAKETALVQTDVIINAVSKSVEEPLRNAFDESMKSVFIPAYEAATRQMFAQISSVLEKGLADSSSNQVSSSNAVENMSAKIDAMARAIESLSSEVVELRSIISSQGTNAVDGEELSAMTTTDALEEARNDIILLLSQRQYELAFTKALSASTAEMAVFCCKNASLPDVLGGNSPGISQPILLCLMQQLGAVLVSSIESDLQTNLEWLQEIALTLDTTNESIKRHVPTVLHQLVASINEKMAQGDPALRRPLQMLLQVIRGMMR